MRRKLSMQVRSPLNPDDLELTRRYLLPIVQRHYSGVTKIGKLVIVPLGSVQHGRGVIHVRAQLIGRKTGTVDLYGNFDVWGGSQVIYRFLRHLTTHGFDRGLFRSPRPLSYSSRYRLLIYESFAGRRVRDDLESGRLPAASLQRTVIDIAGWLKKFHALPPRVGMRRKMELSPNTFAHLTIPHRRMLLNASRAINKIVANTGHASLVHGDPHLANVIRGHGGTLALIDYSESYLGNPLADIAMFLVHLDVALKRYFSRSKIAKIQQAFIRAYFGRDAENLPLATRRDLAAFQVRTAAMFLRFTSDHHRRPTPDVAWMMRRFEQIITTGTKGLESGRPNIVFSI